MKILVNESFFEKSYKPFSKLMKEYSDLKKSERPYDFWDYNKQSYVDYSPINFYDGASDWDDDWDDDDWIFQYAETKPYNGDDTDNYPLLIYVRSKFTMFTDSFGRFFEPLLKRWFEETYGLEVKKVVDDHDAYEILDIYN